MTIPYRSIFTFAVVALLFHCGTALTCLAAEPDEDVFTTLSWNIKNAGAPFLPQANSASTEVAGPLVYPAGDFTLPLLQALSFEPACDCYSLIVSAQRANNLEIVHFWRARSGFYRTGNGPYLELENIDSLISVTALSGTRFLFAQVGNGEWRCVSIHDPVGNYLLIDYKADGLIGLLRDSLARTATPNYSEGRMISLTQAWTTPAGRQLRTTSLQ